VILESAAVVVVKQKVVVVSTRQLEVCGGDGKTGHEFYRERLGGACNSSPIGSDGHVYLSDNDGKTFVVKGGRAFKLLATNPLGERITASPAVTGNRLIYRTDSHLYCIGTD